MNNRHSILKLAAITLSVLLLRSAGEARAQDTTNPAAGVTTSPAVDDAVDLTTTHFVTVHLKAVKPDVAAAAVAKQAGVSTRITVSSIRNPKGQVDYAAKDFDLENQPFCLALLRLCSVFDLREPTSSRDDGLILQKRVLPENGAGRPRPPEHEWALSPYSVSGPFVVLAREMTRYRTIEPISQETAVDQPQPAVAASGSDSLNMSIDLFAEPGIVILQRPFFPVMDTFVDDQNGSLWVPPAPDGIVPRIPAGNSSPCQLSLPVQQPNAQATHIAKFSGYVRLQVVTRTKKIEFSCAADGKSQEADFDGTRAVFSGLTDKPRIGQEGTITLYRDEMDQTAWAARATLVREGSRIRAVDKDGNTLPQSGQWGNGATADQMTINLRFARNRPGDPQQNLALPAKLSCDFPVDKGEVQVPFSFENLPLPPK